uniref:RING-type domain-containing protein n=1 Tax=Ananas comosus var. bracteatus TaxID=296719 RepID=A0A6V7PVJ4_ANACO|nr:unnamed protein product [Ananas comosus var. bracteatus]
MFSTVHIEHSYGILCSRRLAANQRRMVDTSRTRQTATAAAASSRARIRIPVRSETDEGDRRCLARRRMDSLPFGGGELGFPSVRRRTTEQGSVHPETGKGRAGAELSPPRTRESLRRDFAGRVRKAVSRCGTEWGLKELRVVARVTVAIESGLAAERCPICLDEFGEEQQQQVLLNFGILGCGHGFHYRCISTWLELASTCPVCRHII